MNKRQFITALLRSPVAWYDCPVDYQSVITKRDVLTVLKDLMITGQPLPSYLNFPEDWNIRAHMRLMKKVVSLALCKGSLSINTDGNYRYELGYTDKLTVVKKLKSGVEVDGASSAPLATKFLNPMQFLDYILDEDLTITEVTHYNS